MLTMLQGHVYWPTSARTSTGRISFPIALRHRRFVHGPTRRTEGGAARRVREKTVASGGRA